MIGRKSGLRSPRIDGKPVRHYAGIGLAAADVEFEPVGDITKPQS